MQGIDNGTEVPIGKKRHDLFLDALNRRSASVTTST